MALSSTCNSAYTLAKSGLIDSSKSTTLLRKFCPIPRCPTDHKAWTGFWQAAPQQTLLPTLSSPRILKVAVVCNAFMLHAYFVRTCNDNWTCYSPLGQQPRTLGTPKGLMVSQCDSWIKRWANQTSMLIS